MNARAVAPTLPCLLLGLCLSAPLAADPVALADEAAGKWLALVDGGQYRQSWQRAASLFRQRIGVADWEQAVRAARAPLGAMLSRKLIDATHSETLPGAPDGDYVVLRYRTDFRRKRGAIETVTPMLDQGQWRVSGYFIR